MLALLLACAPIATSPAHTSESLPDSVRSLHLEEEGGTYYATMAALAPVIVACERDDGGMVYGPAEDIFVGWRDGTLTVNPSVEYVDCAAWAWR